MPTFRIKNRLTGAVQYECELSAEVAGSSYSIRLGYAIKSALASGSDLRGSDLRYSDLRGSNLRGSNLSGSDLSGSDLSGCDLSGSNLRYSDLRYSNLRYGNLSDSNLRGSNLRDSNLSGSDLSGSDLSGCDLSGSNLRYSDLRYSDLRYSDLRGCDLSGSDLSDSNLSGSNLSDSNLSYIKQDFLAEVMKLPNELEALRAAIVDGRIDGSTYSGECACLAGTLAKARHSDHCYSGSDIQVAPDVTFHAAAASPRESFFSAIQPGDTPEKNAAAKVALDWTNEAIAIRDMIRATAPKGGV